MKVPDGFDVRFRQLTPLVLFGVLLVVVLAPWLPGAAWLDHTFGQGFVTRVAVAVLAFYVLVLWGESIRLHTMLTGVLQAFRDFDGNRGKDPAAGKNPRARLEAAKLLIAALKSDDAEIRATSRHNLQRLVGKDLGPDPAAWTAWLAEQSG
jgi:hypothetical protein